MLGVGIDSGASRLADFGFRLPAPALRGLVSTYYWLEAGAEPVAELLHPEWTNVRFGLRGDWRWQQVRGQMFRPDRVCVFGPSNCAASIMGSPGALVLGFGLLPLGWARLVGGPASQLANRFCALQAIWGPAADRLMRELSAAAGPDEWAAILDDELLARLENAPPPPRLLADAHRLLGASEIDTVERFAAELGVSERTLERSCGPWFGFGPKTLLRRLRFLRVLDAMLQLPEGHSVGTVLGEHFVDQSHFVREFHAFMGMTPTAYMAMPRVVMRRAMHERARLLGHSMQVLHTPGDADLAAI